MKMTLMVSLVSKINMARNRIKVHPFGFKKNQSVKETDGIHYYRVQTVKVHRNYEVPVYDKKGNLVRIDTFVNTFIKNIRHSIASKPRRGRTLADMVYESMPV